MLTKFETRSDRVKGVAFHPTRPWVLASLHSGEVQLWDYRYHTLVETFRGHDKPVRGVHFHPSQPIFATGSDDYCVKLWSHQSRRFLFTLSGHLDYIRTVHFHHSSPWLLSASDDQTIRIWNWQSRQCISVLTGHNHYVMSASFHPSDDLIVSASLDQTVRVWDIGGVRRKSPSSSSDDVFRLPQQVNSDLFGTGDAVVKYVLEGHDRGVNWASFHPSLPLIVSGADDRQVKIWRMNDTKAWEVDTLRGHLNNVSCVLFHPKNDLVLSNSEDKSIRVWDMSRRVAIQTARREHDRFWVLAAHPHANLHAAGHDSGLVVFKVDRERPPHASHKGVLFYVKDRHLRMYEYSSRKDSALCAVRRPGGEKSSLGSIRCLSYNPAEQTILLSNDTEQGAYELMSVSNEALRGRSEQAPDAKRGGGKSATFIARNRFAVLDTAAGSISVKKMDNEVVKRIFAPLPSASAMFYAGTGAVLVKNNESVSLFDLQQRASLATIEMPGARHVAWSEDGAKVCIMGKNDILLASKRLQRYCQIHETINVKSGVWDDNGVFLYTTVNHLKYALTNGDRGTIRSLEKPLYLTKVFANTVFALDRDGKPQSLEVDTSEFSFKLNLLNRSYDQAQQLLKSPSLHGRTMVSYLQEKGFSEVALIFARDQSTRIELALECGNLEVALSAAEELDQPSTWQRLGAEALRQGNHQVVEFAYQKTKNFERLSFLYLISGNKAKLSKMLKLAEMNGEKMGRFHNALYLGDASERVKILESSGQLPLAYATASTHGLDDEANRLRDKLTYAGCQIPSLPDDSTQLRPPEPIRQEGNWPLLAAAGSPMDGMTLASSKAARVTAVNASAGKKGAHASESVGLEEADADGVGAAWDEEGIDLMRGQMNGEADGPKEGFDQAEEEFEEGWAMEDLNLQADVVTSATTQSASDGNESASADTASFTVPPEGSSWQARWNSSASVAIELAAAGSFEAACRLLRRQIGCVNFDPLKQGMIAAAACSHAALPGLPCVPQPELPLFKHESESDSRKQFSSPATPYTLQQCEEQLQRAYKLTTDGKFSEAYKAFLIIMHTLPLVQVGTKKEVDDGKELISIAREYIVGLRVEMKRKETKDDQKRNAELAAYFTHCSLQPIHASLALRSAMFIFYKMGNHSSACGFSRRLLDLNPPTKFAQQARQVLSSAEQSPADAIEIDYDPRNPFTPCPETYKPLYRGTRVTTCPYCAAPHDPSLQFEVCAVCQLGCLGMEASGLVLCSAQSNQR